VLVAVLDTSTPAVTAGLALIDPHLSGVDGVELLAERRPVDGRGHGELLAPALHEVLTSAGVTGRDLAAVVAGLGPGPFTGLRVGLVTAVALGQALGIPTYGVCSLDAIGLVTPGSPLVLTDARRKEVYWARYEHGIRRGEPAVDRPEAVPTDDADAVVGDGAHLYATRFDLPLRTEPRYPPSWALAMLAADRVRGREPGEALTPLYLRRPDAMLPGPPKLVSQ
jgi:tRNA threonylcarbamoyl adenosine modification protein YeaZ